MLPYHDKRRFPAIRYTLIGLVILLLTMPYLTSCSPTESFTPLNLGIPDEALHSPVTGELPGDTILPVRVTFKMNENWLKQADQQTQTDHKSNLKELAHKIGIDDETYQKIKDFFNFQGLKLKLSKLRTHLAINGKASTFARLLQTKFVVHSYHNRTFYAPDVNQPAKVPGFLANWIDVVTGLDNYSNAPTHDIQFYPDQLVREQHSQQVSPGANCYPNEQTLFPKDIATSYGYKQLWENGLHGEHMTVNLVEIDGSYVNDIRNYLNCIDFKGKLNFINVDGKPQDAQGESTLDIEMIAGLARSININVYQTDISSTNNVWTQINDMLQNIIDDNIDNVNSGNTVSISLGAAEGEISSNDIQAIDSSLQQLTRIVHMTVFVASGDCGAFTNRKYGDLSVAYPASDPWVTAVGGTFLHIHQDQTRAQERAWSDGSNRSECRNQWGTGGGNSMLFQQPGWQHAPGVNKDASNGSRQLPDIAAAAYALAVYFNEQWTGVGGTSAAAPIWAAGMSLINQGLIQHHHKIIYGPQFFYQAINQAGDSRPYFDVTQGNNLYYQATPGWDYTTGLGTPNLAALYQVATQMVK